MAENYFGVTDTGKVRTNNEDTFIAQPAFDNRLVAVCVIDGVGGYEGGEVAARIAHDVIIESLTGTTGDYIQLMKNAITEANDAIYMAKKNNQSTDKMACVLTMALADIPNNKIYYSHVGDTRLYLFRDKSLVKITRDHSFVGFLEDSGRLTEDAAMRHPKRNEINKALGFDAQLKTDDYIETGESPFLPQDIILLCSDGLSDMVANATITNILSKNQSLPEKAKELVNAANEAGGKDNITVVLVQNDKSPLKQVVTKPVVNTRQEEKQGGDEVIKQKITNDQKSVVNIKKRSSTGPFLVFLLFLILAAFGWIIYQNYYNQKAHEKQLQNTVIKKERNAAEQKFLDSINRNTTNEVFVLNTPDTKSIVITDSILVQGDSLHILGNGVTLVSDTSYKGPAFTVMPSCKYLLLDSLTLENFDIGVLTKNTAIHLKKVHFKNCRVPVQYNILFKEQPVINGRFADTIFYNSDSFKL